MNSQGTTKNIRKRKMSTIAIHNEIRDLIIDFDSLRDPNSDSNSDSDSSSE